MRWKDRRLFLLIPVLFGALLAGCSSPPLTVHEVLRLMTYNIHYGASAAGQLDINATAESIRRAGAQVVLLQEVDRDWGARSGYLDEAAYLARSLHMHMCYGATLDKEPEQPGHGEFGLAILSFFPISSWSFHFLPSVLEQRGVLLAELETPFGTIPVACAHLGLSSTDRQAQVAEMLAWLPEDPRLLIGGDYNVESSAPEVQTMCAQYTDLQAACGQAETGTFYYQERWCRIDYLFADTGWEALSAQVIASDASDHYPVVVEVEIPS